MKHTRQLLHTANIFTQKFRFFSRLIIIRYANTVNLTNTVFILWFNDRNDWTVKNLFYYAECFLKNQINKGFFFIVLVPEIHKVHQLQKTKMYKNNRNGDDPQMNCEKHAKIYMFNFEHTTKPDSPVELLVYEFIMLFTTMTTIQHNNPVYGKEILWKNLPKVLRFK